jgi:hypothetical protein
MTSRAASAVSSVTALLAPLPTGASTPTAAVFDFTIVAGRIVASSCSPDPTALGQLEVTSATADCAGPAALGVITCRDVGHDES